MARIPASSASAEDTTADFIVAPGRTVMVEDIPFGPGATVSLDVKEGEYLRARGFFRADDGSVSISASGPAVNVQDGIRVEPA
jgi:hypothetical protein